MKMQGLCLLPAMIVISLAAAADEPLGSPSSMLGQLYLRYDIDMYRGVMYFERHFEDGRTESVRADFHLNLQFQVTRFEVGREVLHDDSDNPLPGLPENAEGQVGNYNLSLWGLSGDQSVLYGSTHSASLKPGESIVVTLYPNWETRFMPYDPPGDVDPDNLDLEVAGWLIGRYHSTLGGFRYWLDPLGGEVVYRIIDQSTGRVLETGQVSPVNWPKESPDHPVSIQLAGGVMPVDLTERPEVSYRGVTLDGWEWVGEEKWPAKVFIVTRNDNEPTWLYFQDFDGMFEVLEWQPRGEMTPVEVGLDLNAFKVPSGSEKLVVIFYDDHDYSFLVRFSRLGGLG